MMKRALYYILEQDGRCRQVVNGVVTSLMNKKPLPNAPIGNNDIAIAWERVMSRYAQVRNFGLPLGFPTDGAMILRDAMYFNTVDRQLHLLIQLFRSDIDANFFYDRYHFLYKGELDFSTFSDQPADSKVEINILEGGLSKLVKANENTQFFMPFDEDAINIEHDGLVLDEKAIYDISPIADSSELGPYESLKTISFNFINKEGSSSGIALFSQYTQQISSSDTDYMAASTNYWAINTGPSTVNIRVRGKLNFRAILIIGTVDYSAYFMKSDGTPYLIYSNQSLTTNTVYSEDFDFTIPLAPNEKLFLFAFYSGDGIIDVATIEYLETDPAIVTFSTRKQTTYIKAFTPLSAYKKLCSKLGISQDKAISNLLTTSPVMLTSGDGIRGISGSGIKTSFNEFFKAYDTYHMAGCSIRETINIEDRLTFFDATSPIALGESSDFKVSPAIDLMYSSIKVGHKEQDIDDVNGKYDFNGQMIFTTPVKRGGGKELDLTSPYKAGPFEIESIRATFEGRDSTDSEQDNQVFAIVCNAASNVISTTVDFQATGNKMIVGAGVKLIEGQTIRITGSASNDRDYVIQSVTSLPVGGQVVLDVTVINEAAVPVTITILMGKIYTLDRSITVTSGVPNPSSVYNVAISPKRILMAHYRWIRSWLYNYEPQSIIWQQSNRNSDLVAGGITEKADVPIPSMGALIFKPYYLEFKTPASVDIATQLDVNPEKAFSTIWDNVAYSGFTMKAGLAPNNEKPQVFKLLSTPENDLTNLII